MFSVVQRAIFKKSNYKNIENRKDTRQDKKSFPHEILQALTFTAKTNKRVRLAFSPFGASGSSCERIFFHYWGSLEWQRAWRDRMRHGCFHSWDAVPRTVSSQAQAFSEHKIWATPLTEIGYFSSKWSCEVKKDFINKWMNNVSIVELYKQVEIVYLLNSLFVSFLLIDFLFCSFIGKLLPCFTAFTGFDPSSWTFSVWKESWRNDREQ